MRYWIVICLMLTLVSPLHPQAVPSCPDNLAPRLTIGSKGRVLPGNANRMRAEATTASEQVGQIPGEDEFTVLAGPVCADGYTWWQVDYDGVIGWTVEGDDEYWLEPILAVETPEVILDDTCPGFLPPGLIAGENGQVDTALTSLNVRSTPDGERLDGIAGGTVFAVVAGPECTVSGVWWQISSGSLTGWVLEGTAEVYWLEPLSPEAAESLASGQITAANAGNLTEIARYGRGNVQDVAWVNDTTLIIGTTLGMWVYALDNSHEPYVIENPIHQFDFDMDVNLDGSYVAAVTCSGYSAAGCNRSGVTVWDIASGTVIRRYDGAINGSPHVSFGGTTKNVLAIGDASVIRLWNIETGGVTAAIDVSGQLDAIDFSADERSLGVLTARGSEDVVRWVEVSGSEHIITNVVSNYAFDPNIERVALFGEYEGQLRVTGARPFPSLERVGFLPEAWSINLITIPVLAFAPDGNWLAAGSHTGSLVIQDLTVNEPILTIDKAHVSAITALAFSPDQTKIATVSLGRVNIWSVSGELIDSILLSGQNWKLLPLLAAKPAAELTTFSEQYWDTVVTNLAAQRGSIDQFPSLVYSANHTWMVTLMSESDVQVFNGLNGDWVRELKLTTPQYAAAFNPDETILALGGADGLISLWDTASGESLGSLATEETTHAVRNLLFTPDGKSLIAAYAETTIRIWDVQQRQMSESFEYPEDETISLIQLAVNADGSLLAYGQRQLHLRNLQTQEDLPVSLPMDIYVVDLAFNADGSLLAFNDYASAVHLWDWQAGTVTDYAVEDAGRVAFSPDGTRLFVGGSTNLVIELGLP